MEGGPRPGTQGRETGTGIGPGTRARDDGRSSLRGTSAYDAGAMSPALLLTLLVAMLVALIPVWRLRVAGWPPRSLFTAWVVYAVGVFAAVRFPGPSRVLIPILVLAYVAPFVAGPERLTRLLHGRRREPPGVVIDVTPRPAPGLKAPPRTAADDDRDEGGASDDTDGDA
jgi:hypothetical protein